MKNLLVSSNACQLFAAIKVRLLADIEKRYLSSRKSKTNTFNKNVFCICLYLIQSFHQIWKNSYVD